MAVDVTMIFLAEEKNLLCVRNLGCCRWRVRLPHVEPPSHDMWGITIVETITLLVVKGKQGVCFVRTSDIDLQSSWEE